MEKEWSLRELAAETGVPERTIRYYISRGLVPPPLRGGRGAAYGDKHKEAIEAIRNLQAGGMMLADIAQSGARWGSRTSELNRDDRDFLNNPVAPETAVSKSVYLEFSNKQAPAATLPDPAVWRSYSLADDVVVMFRAGVSPWRTKRVMSALSRFSEAIHIDADNNNQGGSNE